MCGIRVPLPTYVRVLTYTGYRIHQITRGDRDVGIGRVTVPEYCGRVHLNLSIRHQIYGDTTTHKQSALRAYSHPSRDCYIWFLPSRLTALPPRTRTWSCTLDTWQIHRVETQALNRIGRIRTYKAR